MTTYVPSLTLPSFLFENPAAAILLPVACGTAIGFSISRMRPVSVYRHLLTDSSKRHPNHIQGVEAASAASAGLGLWPSMDRSLRYHGLHCLPRLDGWRWLN
jgi:hypothetical protein